MAKSLCVSLGAEEARFQMSSLDRQKLYGRRRRVLRDPDGKPCRRADLTLDGTLLLQSGMTGQGYVDESLSFVERGRLIRRGPDGQELPLLPGTLDTPQPLEGPVPPEDLLDLHLSGVQMLSPLDLPDALKTRLEAGEIFRFAYSYSADVKRETAFLLANAEGIFALIGQPLTRDWVRPDLKGLPDPEPEGDLEDDLDFEMF